MPESKADDQSVRQLRARIAGLEAELEALRRAAAAPATDEAQYRKLFESLPDAVVIHQDEHIAFANAAAARLVGADTPEQLIGRRSLTTVPPEYAAQQRERRRKVLEERCALPLIEQERRRFDGSTLWVETAGTFIMWKGKPAFLGVLRDVTNRRKAQEALRQSEEQYRNLLEALPEGVIIHHGEGIVFVNRAAVELLGAKSKDELLGRNPLCIVPPHHHKAQLERRRAIMSERGPVPMAEQQRLRVDGSTFWAETVATFTLWQGKPAVLGLFRDISEHKEAQERAAQTDNWLRSAIDSMPEGFMLWDADDRLVLWNEQILRFYPRPDRLKEGASFEDLVNGTARAMREKLGDEPAQEWLDARHRQHREATGEHEFAGRNGTNFVVAERRTPEGFTVTLVTDVTAHRESEKRYRALIDLSPDAIYVHKEGRIVLCNDAAVRLFGAPDAAALMGVDTLDLVEPEFRTLVRDYQRRSAASGTKTAYMRQRRLQLDGTPFWAEVAVAAIDWEGERGGIVIVRDVSGQMRAEEQLRRSKEQAELANRAKTEFLANISHELRTPLNAIIGFSDLMRREMFGPLGSEQYIAYARDINQSGTHLHDMINDILDLSKVEAGRLDLHEEEMDVGAAIRRCIRLLRPRADASEVALEARIADGLPMLRADPRKVKQILINLLSNAVKFTEPGGRVTVEASTDDHGGLVMTVADTGIGMTAEDIEVALQPFGQVDSALNRKYEGTGLGLPLSRSLAELHDGIFDIESAPGRGTRISVRFPSGRIVARSSAAE